VQGRNRARKLADPWRASGGKATVVLFSKNRAAVRKTGFTAGRNIAESLFIYEETAPDHEETAP